MKKLLFLLIFLFFIFSANTYQEKSLKIRVKGSILFEDTIEEVTFMFHAYLMIGGKFIDYSRIANGVKYLDVDGKIITVRPNEIRGITFRDQGKKFIFASKVMPFYKNINLKPATKLLELAINGRVKLFWLHLAMANGNGGTFPNKTYYLQKEEENLIEPRSISFKRDMKEYFSDCPALVTKIDKREIRGSNIEDAVIFYNNQCE